jgi:hypothetical protein
MGLGAGWSKVEPRGWALSTPRAERLGVHPRIPASAGATGRAGPVQCSSSAGRTGRGRAYVENQRRGAAGSWGLTRQPD